MIFAAFWQHNTAPVRLVLHTRTTSDGSTSKSVSRAETIPALFSQWWIVPTVLAAKSPKSSTSRGSVTSHAAPAHAAAGNSERSALTASSTRICDRPQMQTRSPRARNSRAMAYPTPFVPPVMTIPKPSAGAGNAAAPRAPRTWRWRCRGSAPRLRHHGTGDADDLPENASRDRRGARAERARGGKSGRRGEHRTCRGDAGTMRCARSRRPSSCRWRYFAGRQSESFEGE